MGLNKSEAGNEDVRQYLDRALAAENGLHIRTGTKSMAISLRHRMYAYRRTDRIGSKVIYPEGDPRHGTSAYDCLQITISNDGTVTLTKAAATFEMEEF